MPTWDNRDTGGWWDDGFPFRIRMAHGPGGMLEEIREHRAQDVGWQVPPHIAIAMTLMEHEEVQMSAAASNEEEARHGGERGRRIREDAGTRAKDAGAPGTVLQNLPYAIGSAETLRNSVDASGGNKRVRHAVRDAYKQAIDEVFE